jgi:hypothetical protein
LAAEVILRHHYYRHLVAVGRITIASPAPPRTTFANYLNGTIEDVARFFAEQGISVADIEDAALYAATWLQTFNPHNAEAALAASVLRGRMPPLIRLPAGINDHYRTLTGATDNRPPAITDVQLTPTVVPTAPQVFNPPPVPLPQASSIASTSSMTNTIAAGATAPASSSSGPAPAGPPPSPSGDTPPQMDESDG